MFKVLFSGSLIAHFHESFRNISYNTYISSDLVNFNQRNPVLLREDGHQGQASALQEARNGGTGLPARWRVVWAGGDEHDGVQRGWTCDGLVLLRQLGSRQRIPLRASAGQGGRLEGSCLTCCLGPRPGQLRRHPRMEVPTFLWSKAVPLHVDKLFFLPCASSGMETFARHSDLGAHIFRVRTHMFREVHTWHELMDLGSEQPTHTRSSASH